jgi:hypothetical protein
MDYVTNFCTQQHIQVITALYLRTQGVQKPRLESILQDNAKLNTKIINQHSYLMTAETDS